MTQQVHADVNAVARVIPLRNVGRRTRWSPLRAASMPSRPRTARFRPNSGRSPDERSSLSALNGKNVCVWFREMSGGEVTARQIGLGNQILADQEGRPRLQFRASLRHQVRLAPSDMTSASTLTFRGSPIVPHRPRQRAHGPKLHRAISAGKMLLKVLAALGLVAGLITLGATAGAQGPSKLLTSRALTSFVPIAERRADFDEVPRDCAALKKNPIAFDKSCKRKGGEFSAGASLCDRGGVRTDD